MKVCKDWGGGGGESRELGRPEEVHRKEMGSSPLDGISPPLTLPVPLTFSSTKI